MLSWVYKFLLALHLELQTCRRPADRSNLHNQGIYVVLGQDADNKLHPCAFFSRQLAPAERNYDVGN